MKTGYKEELPGRSYEHQAHKRKKASSTARDSSEDRLERDDCSSKRAWHQRRGSVSSEASGSSADSGLRSKCSVDSALGSECSAGSPAESVNSLEGALETDCSVDSPVASECSGHSKLASDCSVDRPMESDTSVSRTENSNPEPSVSSHDQHHGNRMMDDELSKKKFEKLLERRTYMWRKALLNKRDSSKGRSVRSRKSPEASDCPVDSPEASDCSVYSPEASDCSVYSPEASDCSVYSPEASDCPVDSPEASDCSVYSPEASDCSVDSPEASDCSVYSPEAIRCSVDSPEASDCSVYSPEAIRCSVDSPETVRCSVGSPETVRCSVGSPETVRCSVGSPETVRCSVDSPETVRCSVGSPETVRCSVDSPETVRSSVDSPMGRVYSVRRVSPQKPQRSPTLGSPAASFASVASPLTPVNSAATDCSVDGILRSRVNASENIFTEVEMEVLEKTSLKTFLLASRQRAVAAGSEAVHAFSQLAAYVRNFIKEYPEDLERISKDDLNNLNEKDSFTASLLPPSAPASVISMDSPLASVSSVASDCSEERFINFSSGNPQSSQPCSSPARVISMDSPLASVSSEASDCSEERFVNFSSGNPQSSQPCRAAAGSDAPPVSLHDSGSSWLDIMIFTDNQLEEINDLQSSPNTTSWSAPTPVYCQDSEIEMNETVSFYDDTETIPRFRDVSYYDDLFSIIEDELINLNEKAPRTASASPSLPRMAAKEMIIAETASDTLMNSSGKPNTQRKPAQSKTTQCKTPQPNHNSKPDSSVNKENSARPDFYNQGTVSSSAHGDFINNRANYRSSGNHFTSVTAQAAETASHVMFEAVQAAETAASQLMLKGVQTPAEAEASQLMLKAAQVAEHANEMFMGAQRATEAAASLLMFREAQRPAETNVMFSEAWEAAAASMVICKVAQRAAAASQLMFKAAQRLAEAGVLFGEVQREATASLLMVNAARKTAIASQSMFKVALGAEKAAFAMFTEAQRPAEAKESQEIYMAVQAEAAAAAAAASPFIFKAAQRAAAERQFQRCRSSNHCTQYVHLQPYTRTPFIN
ncbi:uncharacterized protein LOC117966775 isoform X2 [Acipenser ruthenus]|uniref:uncharacterized protein LOC117966775 isoform X2 n=1 Tax=Acipenser ruthenus TaxID=7906 RepID=UPI002741E2AD|nr:uncharacterized protein LOC117966775 isoform X2 [Acipenser ruthenus]